MEFFTVYQTQDAIELRCGREDLQNCRIVCSSLLYDSAYHIAVLSAHLNQLTFVNHTCS